MREELEVMLTLILRQIASNGQLKMGTGGLHCATSLPLYISSECYLRFTM